MEKAEAKAKEKDTGFKIRPDGKLVITEPKDDHGNSSLFSNREHFVTWSHCVEKKTQYVVKCRPVHVWVGVFICYVCACVCYACTSLCVVLCMHKFVCCVCYACASLCVMHAQVCVWVLFL